MDYHPAACKLRISTKFLKAHRRSEGVDLHVKGLDGLSVFADLVLVLSDSFGVLLRIFGGLGNSGLDHVFGLQLILG